MHIFLYFIISIGILQSGAIIINQPGNSIQNQLVEPTLYACQQGYFFNGQICIQCQSIDNGFCNCKKYNECDSIICGNGFYLFESQCIQHPDSNCLKGSLSSDGSTVICLQCSGQSTLIGGICIANNNCQQFDTLTGICKKCQPGYYNQVGLGYEEGQVQSSTYYQSINQCKQCLTKCSSCQNEQLCTGCQSGYFLEESKCFQCVNYLSNCLTCDTSSKCTSCAAEFYLNINKCLSCQQQISNCQDCSLNQSNQLNCSKCKDGSYLNNNQCTLCSTSISYCQNCQDSTICQVCSKGFYLNYNRCYMCSASISNCLFCSNSNTCQICADGYYLQSNVCIKCSISLSNCGTCSNNQNCTGCMQGYYLDDSKNCQICSGSINYCNICSNSSKCDKCKTGYYWDDTNCKPCTDSNCTECSNSSSCSTCLISYSTDGSKCTSCATASCTTCSGQSYLYNGSCSTCSSEMNGCSKCGYEGNNLKCITCLPGYDQPVSNSQPCEPDAGANCNAQQFAYGDTCKNCSQGIANCSECSYQNQQLVCTKCNSGYVLGGSCEPCQSSGSSSGSGSSSAECQKCAQGTYLDDASTTCKTCSGIQNCSACSNAQTCTKCNIGYFWNNSQCVLCAKQIFNCGSCSDGQTCTQCLPGFTLDGSNCIPCSYFITNCLVCKTNSICQQCAQGNYLNAQNTCSSCDDPNCINCSQSSSQCTACVSGTYLNGTQCQSCSNISKCIACSNDQKCIACQSGTFLKNDQCQQCDDQNCINCNSSSNCAGCIAGYYVNNNNGCSQCSNGCTSCLSNSQCSSCQNGFYLDGTTCVNCTDSLTKCLACINSQTCTNCDVGYFLDGSSCTKCPNSLTSCSACKSNTICIACNSGSYLNDSQCSSCNDTNCINCTNASTCISCGPTYVVINNSCTKCIGYSDKCTSCFNGYCNSCINNYLIQQDGTCLKCPDNCTSGCTTNTIQNSNPTICQICQDQYYLNSSGQCIKCSSTFLRCKYDSDTQQIYPTQCVDGYFLINKQCIKAQDENTCQKLYQSEDNSQINSQLCSDCWPTYLQNNQLCYKCPYCTDNSCQLDQNNNKPICSLCVNYYYSDSNFNCQQCIPNCIQCNAAGIENCQQCDIGYYKSSNACIPCTTDKNNKTTCLNCQNENTCSLCINGYYESNGQCLACQYGCNQCISPGNTCISCINGFYLQNGGCVKDLGNCLEKQQNQNNGCQICAYGFYPIKGWLTQLNQSQIVDVSCLQCVYPQTAFVCRSNPQDNQVVSASYGTIPSIKNSNYFKSAAPLGSIRLTTPQCKVGSFWNQQSCMPCPIINNGICAICSNLSSCIQIQCNPQYQLTTINNNQQCTQIPLGCSDIQYSDKFMSIACIKCNVGYILIGNICISINGCLTIDQNNGACSQCTNGYYFNWDFLLSNSKTSLSTNTYYYQYFNSFCSKCNTGCAICPSQYTCTKCLPGYYWYQSTLAINSYQFKIYTNAETNASGQCIACPKNCQTCSSTIICTICNTNFTIDPNSTNGDCICTSPYTYNSTDQTCIVQPSANSTCSFVGCIQCNSDNTQCQMCDTQYALTSQTQCTLCLNCNQCNLLAGTISPTCLECADGYYKVQAYDGAPITCQLCSSVLNNALRCQGVLEQQTQLTIIQCADNYFLFGNTCYQASNSNCYTVANSNNQSCQQCLPGYTLYGNNCDQCNAKIVNCLTCVQNQDSTGLICQSCINGYVLNTNTNSCQQCPSGCQNCTITNTTVPYTLSCNTCAIGNYIDSNSNCQGCPFDCKSCNSKYICNNCNDGYYLVQNSIIFNTKSYIFKPCYPCQNNCATCTGPTGNICQTCKPGFVLQNGGCIDLNLKILNDPIPYNLANCYTSDSTGCTVCLAGFFLDSQRICQECISPYTNFVCGLKPISSQTISDISNGQFNDNQNASINSIKIGYNPTQPNSVSLLQAIMLIFMIQ